MTQMTQLNSPSGAIVLDAIVAVAVAARETGTEAKANALVTQYLSAGRAFFAPGGPTVSRF